MSDRNDSADIGLLISRSAANERFREALRMFVGRGKRYSVKQVSNGTGIKDRMLESFMAQVDSTDFRKPDLEEVLTLASFIGPDFTTELLQPAQQGAFWLPGDEPAPGELAADNADDNAVVTRAARDGVFDKDERKDLKVVGTRLVSRGAQLVALSAAA
jgi:hypothetical protein